MSVTFDIHDNMANHPSDIVSKLVETPRLCMLLNPELTPKQIGMLTDTFYIVEIEHEGTQRLAILCGFYQQSQEAVVEPQLYDMWNELAEEKEAE